MHLLPSSAQSNDVLLLVEHFVALLAAEDYVGAHALLLQPEALSYWTPDLIKEVISSYGPPTGLDTDLPCRVTPTVSARILDVAPNHEVRWFDEPSTLIGASAGYVHYDLPISGVWSDLTAIFEIHKDAAGCTLALEDIHVL